MESTNNNDHSTYFPAAFLKDQAERILRTLGRPVFAVLIRYDSTSLRCLSWGRVVAANMAIVTEVRFEHYLPGCTLGVHETRPRLSWKLRNTPKDFKQHSYDIELSEGLDTKRPISLASVTSPLSSLVPWPFEKSLISRQSISIRIRIRSKETQETQWSKPAVLETGLLNRSDWQCERIAAPWGPHTPGPDSECLFRREFPTPHIVARARLYITAQGVYEAEINGERVGDYFLAPGWTAYDGRLQYQTYDVTKMVSSNATSCIGVRVAEGWFCGRIGWEGGHRNIWGPHPALMVQLEITYADSSLETITSDGSWKVARGT